MKMMGRSEMAMAPTTILVLNRAPSCPLLRSAHNLKVVRARMRPKTRNEAVIKIELHCRAAHIHRERSWSSVANCGQRVSLLFARATFWQDSHRTEASQDSYLSFACKTCPRGQVLAISERWTKFWLLSPSSFAKVSAGCKPARSTADVRPSGRNLS